MMKNYLIIILKLMLFNQISSLISPGLFYVLDEKTLTSAFYVGLDFIYCLCPKNNH